MAKPNEWERRFGAKRRAADKALLEALEAQIVAEELEQARKELLEDPKVKIGAQVKAEYASEELRASNAHWLERIAKAFGRPFP